MAVLDARFFQGLLRREDIVSQGRPDQDVYLLERVLPVLVQGLEALSRHIDGMSRTRVDPEQRQRFRPATWLAQYLLRNHPAHHPTPAQDTFRELADLERARRELLKRKNQVQRMFEEMEKTEREMDRDIAASKVFAFLHALDEQWRLGTALSGAFDPDMPFGEWIELLPSVMPGGQELYPEGVVTFEPFWAWLTDYVETHDFLRMSDFARAEQVRAAEELRDREEERLRDERQQQQLERQQQQREKLEAFDALCEQMQEDPVIQQILEGAYTLGGVEEEDGAAPVQQPHVQLILGMLTQWGVECQGDGRSWDGYALTAWEEWVDAVQLPTQPSETPVSSDALHVFLDRERFRDHLEHAGVAEDCGELLALLEREARGEVTRPGKAKAAAAAAKRQSDVKFREAAAGAETEGDAPAPAEPGSPEHPPSPSSGARKSVPEEGSKAGARSTSKGSEEGSLTRQTSKGGTEQRRAKRAGTGTAASGAPRGRPSIRGPVTPR